jgi:hypothetical protein
MSDTPFTPPSDLIARRVGDTMVLIRLNTNRIYELNATGARIWELLKDGMTRAQVVETLSTEFDASRNEIQSAVDALLDSLRQQELT